MTLFDQNLIQLIKQQHSLSRRYRHLLTLQSRYPHDEHLQHLLDSCQQQLQNIEKHTIPETIHNMAEHHFLNQSFEKGDTVWAHFENEWYVATVLHESHTDNTTNHDDINSSNQQSKKYRVKFIGYNNEEDVSPNEIKIYEDPPVDLFKVGTECHAVYHEDGQLYAGRIQTYLPDTASVIIKFDEYGNIQDTELKYVRLLSSQAKNWYSFKATTVADHYEDAQREFEHLKEKVLLNMPQDDKLDPDSIENLEKEIQSSHHHTLTTKQADQHEAQSSTEKTDQSEVQPSTEKADLVDANSSLKLKLSIYDKPNGTNNRKRKRVNAEDKLAQTAANQWQRFQSKVSKKKAGVIANVVNKKTRIK